MGGSKMNFRSCRYFLTVCDAGSISAAAKRLYISQQSLSQHIRHMERELGVQLFHRDKPLSLTEAGECVRRTAETVLAAMDEMDRTLASIRADAPGEVVLGMLDYGTPEFVPALVEAFLQKEQNGMIRTRQIRPGEEIPADTRLLISAREMGAGYVSEQLFSDRLVVGVADGLLRRQYGGDWQRRRQRLERGELGALEGCPFIRPPQNTPLYDLTERAVASSGFNPAYLPIAGDMSTLKQLCIDGKGAMITFLGNARRTHGATPCYPIAAFPDPLPAAYICYRAEEVLSPPAQKFLELSRRFLGRYNEV